MQSNLILIYLITEAASQLNIAMLNILLNLKIKLFFRLIKYN